jgi:predicted CxxxxCH...CXXCH cytochrome family protein
MRRARHAIAALVFACAACDPRVIAPRAPSWDDVAPVLAERCEGCHGNERAEGGYRVDGHTRAIACPSSTPEVSAVSPDAERAAVLAVLSRDDHAGLLEDAERALVAAWVDAGAPGTTGAVHPEGWADPRSARHHARALRGEGWARLFEGARDDSCTRCHAGASRETEPIDRATAPGATACTSCHTDEGGPFACSTCHGAPGRGHPPRDRCLHPEDEHESGAHVAHVEAGVACTTCHAARDVEGLLDPEASGHGDGAIDVVLDPAIAGEGARLDESDGSCTTACHARGGTVPEPRWQLDRGLDCGSCHASPPADHYAGTCSTCHAEANDDGTALVRGPLHANGIVDLGDGSGTCAACHGEGDDPSPSTGAHLAHAHPRDSLEVGCDACHAVPERVTDAGHLDEVPGAEVSFGARATARGAMPSREGRTCRELACHGAGLGGGTHTTPRWDDESGLAARCGACHATPPPAPHTTSEGCSAISCHGGYSTVDRGVSALGRTVHGDGAIDLWSGR